MTLVEQGIVAHRAGDLQRAEELYRQALARNQHDFDALHMLGALSLQRRQYQDAERLLRAALAIDPRMPPCLHNYGSVLCRLGEPEKAIRIFDEAAALAPNYMPIYVDRGIALSQLGRFGEALASYDKALALNGNFPQTHYNRANALRKLKRYREALAGYDRALALRPDYAAALSNRADVLRELGLVAEAERACRDAERAFKTALQRSPNDPELLSNQADAYNCLGTVLVALGRLDEACEAFRTAIKIDADSGDFYLGLADCKDFAAGDPEIALMESALARTTDARKSDRMYLDAALGKAYADTKDYPRSFRHFLAANAAKRATVGYDEKKTLARFDAVENVFSPQLIAAKAGGGATSPLPIFIIGMPRSGTTLVEQLLASHPAVQGGGELTALRDAVGAAGGAKADAYPEFVPALAPADFGALGADYLRRVAPLAGGRAHVTDKMPSNFFYAGVIHLALPNAVIIHTTRSPVDTCVSCFSKLFSGDGQEYSYDLAELGRFYVHYHRLMAHWRRVLPAGRMLDVRYEDLVANFEVEARRVLAHCGLPWDARCLAFHETDRPVQTASAAQVRRPLYGKAVDRWRVYAGLLDPLLKELGDLGPQAHRLP